MNTSVLSHHIDITLAPALVALLQQNIAELTRQTAPILQGMTPKERKSVRRLGPKSESFVHRTLELARDNQELLPRTFDLDSLERDQLAREQLLPLLQQLQQLTKLMEDTVELLGSDLLHGALDAYKALKLFGKAAGLEEILKELGQTFAKSPRKKTRDEQPPLPTTAPPVPSTEPKALMKAPEPAFEERTTAPEHTIAHKKQEVPGQKQFGTAFEHSKTGGQQRWSALDQPITAFDQLHPVSSWLRTDLEGVSMR